MLLHPDLPGAREKLGEMAGWVEKARAEGWYEPDDTSTPCCRTSTATRLGRSRSGTRPPIRSGCMFDRYVGEQRGLRVLELGAAKAWAAPHWRASRAASTWRRTSWSTGTSASAAVPSTATSAGCRPTASACRSSTARSTSPTAARRSITRSISARWCARWRACTKPGGLVAALERGHAGAAAERRQPGPGRREGARHQRARASGARRTSSRSGAPAASSGGSSARTAGRPCRTAACSPRCPRSGRRSGRSSISPRRGTGASRSTSSSAGSVRAPTPSGDRRAPTGTARYIDPRPRHGHRPPRDPALPVLPFAASERPGDADLLRLRPHLRRGRRHAVDAAPRASGRRGEARRVGRLAREGARRRLVRARRHARRRAAVSRPRIPGWTTSPGSPPATRSRCCSTATSATQRGLRVLEVGAAKAWAAPFWRERDCEYVATDILVDPKIGLGRGAFYGDFAACRPTPSTSLPRRAVRRVVLPGHAPPRARPAADACRDGARDQAGRRRGRPERGHRGASSASRENPDQASEKALGINEHVHTVWAYTAAFRSARPRRPPHRARRGLATGPCGGLLSKIPKVGITLGTFVHLSAATYAQRLDLRPKRRVTLTDRRACAEAEPRARPSPRPSGSSRSSRGSASRSRSSTSISIEASLAARRRGSSRTSSSGRSSRARSRAPATPRAAATRLVRVALLVPDRAGLVDPLDLGRLHGVKYVNAVVMCLTAVPTYLLSRMLVTRRAAVVVALLSIAIPAMGYASSIVPESLAYLWFCGRAWLAVRAARRADGCGPCSWRSSSRRRASGAVGVRRAAGDARARSAPSSGCSARWSADRAASPLAAGAVGRSSSWLRRASSSTCARRAAGPVWSFGQYFNHHTFDREASRPARSRSGSASCR